MFRARISSRSVLLVLVIAVSWGVGCHRDSAPHVGANAKPSTPQPAPRGPRDGVHTFKLNGIVRRVEPASGMVTISHEAIPDFMDAMTMPFTLKDHALLDDVLRRRRSGRNATRRAFGWRGQGLRIDGSGRLETRAGRALEVGPFRPVHARVEARRRRARFRDDRARRQVVSLVRPARERRRVDVYLYKVPFAGLLSASRREVFGGDATRRRIASKGRAAAVFVGEF